MTNLVFGCTCVSWQVFYVNNNESAASVQKYQKWSETFIFPSSTFTYKQSGEMLIVSIYFFWENFACLLYWIFWKSAFEFKTPVMQRKKIKISCLFLLLVESRPLWRHSIKKSNKTFSTHRKPSPPKLFYTRLKPSLFNKNLLI